MNIDLLKMDRYAAAPVHAPNESVSKNKIKNYGIAFPIVNSTVRIFMTFFHVRRQVVDNIISILKVSQY